MGDHMTTPLVGKRQTRARRSLEREGSRLSMGAPGHLFCPSRAATLPPTFSGSASLVSHPRGHARTHQVGFVFGPGLPDVGSRLCTGDHGEEKAALLRAARLAAIEQRDAHRPGLVGEVVGDAGAGEHDGSAGVVLVGETKVGDHNVDVFREAPDEWRMSCDHPGNPWVSRHSWTHGSTYP